MARSKHIALYPFFLLLFEDFILGSECCRTKCQAGHDLCRTNLRIGQTMCDVRPLFRGLPLCYKHCSYDILYNTAVLFLGYL